MTLLNNLIKLGGSAVILKELADQTRDTRINREQTLRRNRAGMLTLGIAMAVRSGQLQAPSSPPRPGKRRVLI